MSRRSRLRYSARWDAALAARDPAVLQKVVHAARRKWPDDPEILYHDVVVDMFHGALDAGARKAVEGLARSDLTAQQRAWFLQAHADCLLLARNPVDLRHRRRVPHGGGAAGAEWAPFPH